MKVLWIILVLVIIAAVVYIVFKEGSSKKVSNTSTPPASEKIVEASKVNIGDFAFTPQEITVPAGTDISFTNNDAEKHTVTADNGKFDQSLEPGQTIKITMDEPGVYKYHCKLHPSMTGTITVE